MSEGPRPTAPAREALLAVHTFPGEFIIKAFGAGAEAFEAAAVAAARDELGDDRVAATVRKTPSGTRQCVTLTLRAGSVDEVIAVYERLSRLPDLQMIL